MTINNNFWILREIESFNERALKQEFSEIEYNVIYERLFRLFQFSRLQNHRGESKGIIGYDDFLDFFGLPYTSGSDFACLSVTNSEYEILPDWFLKYFALTETGDIIAIAKDAGENYRYFNLGKYYDFGRND